MDLQFYNTLSRTKEKFIPIDAKNVRVYACGPTVYDRAHIGNARPAVIFDVLFRLLQYVYGENCVNYVRNITDIDDKINARAASLKNDGDIRPLLEIIRQITDQTISWYHEDMAELNVLPPTYEPRATEFIPKMISMIQSLIDRGHAYLAEGHVLFCVASYPNYGSIARRSLKDMIAGARVEQAPYKKNAMDFVLWKPSTDELPGWESPWGRGRPGWHIECSAMSLELLGANFDIHAGGIDLAFPHHENEAAQSLCANPGSNFANIWMHNGFLQIEGKKMAKSLGNFFTVKDLRDQGTAGDVMRLTLLSTHYRQPLDWTQRKVQEMNNLLNRWRSLTAGIKEMGEPSDTVFAALADDLNTPAAISELHAIANSGDAPSLIASAKILGISLELNTDELSVVIEQILDMRSSARKQKNFAAADDIREKLATFGIVIRDRSDGTKWSIDAGFEVNRLNDIKSKFGLE